MAVTDPTPNYNWDLPDVAADVGTWGTKLREILGNTVTGIDAVVKAISVVANAALSKAGGTMTGTQKQFKETFATVNLGSTVSGAVAIDCSLGNVFYGTVTGNITSLSFTNVPSSGDAFALLLELTMASAFTIAPASSVSWRPASDIYNAGVPSSGVNTFIFYTRDGGAKWRFALMHTAA
jgi:hypothetical protein